MKLSLIAKIEFIGEPWQKRFEDLKKFYEEKGRLPSRNGDIEEKILNTFMRNCGNTKSYNFRPEVNEWVAQRRINNLPISWQVRFENLKNFQIETGRLPSVYSKDPEERKFASWMYGAITPGDPHFRPEVREWCLSLRNRIIKSWEERFEDLKQFYLEHGKLPSSLSKDKNEKSLRGWLGNSVALNNINFRQEVKDWVDVVREEIARKRLEEKQKPKKQEPLFKEVIEYKNEDHRL